MQGYSFNVTARKNAEEQLRKNRGVFESDPEMQTEDKTPFEGNVSEDITVEALVICLSPADSNPTARETFLRLASRTPELKDCDFFISTRMHNCQHDNSVLVIPVGYLQG